MHAKTLKFTGLTAAIVVAAGSIAALSTTSVAAGKPERQVMATTINNPALAQKAGFPAGALNVNRSADGHLTWMMTKGEQQRQAAYNRDFLRPAQRQVAASVVDNGGKNSTQSLFGVSDTSTLMVSPLSFQGANETTKITKQYYYVVVRTGEEADEIWAPLELPSGAIVTGLTAYGYDTSAADNPSFTVYKNCPGGTDNSTGSAPVATVTSGFTGGGYTIVSAASDLVIDNSDCTYAVQADTSGSSTDTDQYVYGVAIRWKRQVSPDPSTSTFLDVPVGAPFHREIEALAASGVVGGCTGGKYCPSNPVTRGQLAAFLARSLGMHWENN